MARARNIKPGLFLNEELAEIDPIGRILFTGLWCIADRRGRLQDRPRRIKAEVLPYDDCDVDQLLNNLADRGFLIRYVSGGESYIQITNFEKHQNPHKNEAESTIPPPEEFSTAPEEHHTSTVQAPEQHSTNPADSLNLIPDTGYLIAEDERAPDDAAPPAASDLPDATDAELYVAGCVRGVRGMANVSDREIILHLREIIANRGSPPTDEAVRQDALKFRDYWTDRRKSQPMNAKWTGWKRAMTSWFSRTSEAPVPIYRNRNGRTREPDFSGIDSWSEQMDALEQRR